MELEDLIIAINSKDKEKIIKILNFNPFLINERKKIGFGIEITPLKAAINKDLEMTKFLIENGAHPFSLLNNEYLLQTVCKKGDIEMIRYFLSIYKNAPDCYFYKTFSLACKNNNFDIIEMFHQDFPLSEILNGLECAIYEDNLDIVNFLCDKYIDPRGLPLLWAICKPDILPILVKHYYPNRIYNGGTILQIAVKYFTFDIFENLLKYCNIESVDDKGRTALFYIDKNTDIKIIKYLLKNSKLNHLDYFNNNAFLYIVSLGIYEEIYDKLSENNIYLNHFFNRKHKNIFGQSVDIFLNS